MAFTKWSTGVGVDTGVFALLSKWYTKRERRYITINGTHEGAAVARVRCPRVTKGDVSLQSMHYSIEIRGIAV